jgi:ATP-dependent helicase HrpB
MRFPTPLPIDDALPGLLAALEAGPSAVLVAPPGAGKTTRVPLALLGAPWRGDGRIVMLEPRRLAARGAAERMASTLGETVGGLVGLRARLATKVGRATRIEVVTEGVFTRMILDDPSLEGVAAVIFDEFHERSLDSDLGLALALDARAGQREDLRILVMSATLDGARVARLLGERTPVVESLGFAYPVETAHLGRDPSRRIEDRMADAVATALRAQSGSILAFLPGQGEIRRVAERLADRIADPAVEIAPLYGAMDMAAQDRAVRPAPPGRRKVVLATSIAETSLTIEGVRVVIDCGLARVPRYEPDIGVTRLETVRVSRAAADQRRGRAGRTEPGVCYRLWDERETQSLAPFAEPEIRAADLSGLTLDLAAWGVADPARLAWLDPPPAPAVIEAKADLARLGALEDGRITPLGRAMRALSLPPRLARMLLAAAKAGDAEEAALAAAVIVERGLGGEGSDLGRRVEALAIDRSPRAAERKRLARGWAEAASRAAAHPRADGSPDTQGSPDAGSRPIGAWLALAYPDRIAKARGAPGAYLLASGRGAALEATDPLARAPFLVVVEMTGRAAATRILLAAPLAAEEIERLAGGRIAEGLEIAFDEAAGALRARRVRRLDAITLASEPAPVPADAAAARRLAEAAARRGVSRLAFSKAQAQLRDRVGFLRAALAAAGRDAGEWPDLTDAALAASAGDWLAPHLHGLTRLDEIDAERLGAALDVLLPWEKRRALDEAAPSHFTAPTGNAHAIDYEGEGAPALAIRVQELYGLTRHPAIAGGALPLTLHLLSPAHRPIQITRDLPGFWRGSWAGVKAEMKGRYPRHPWPDDPTEATPTTRAKPRGT